MHAPISYRIPAILVIFVTSTLITLPDARAAGQLDPEFAGGAGFASFPLGTGERPHDYALSVLVDSSDHIVLSGYRNTGPADPLQRDAVVLRLLDDGSVDPKFGTNGLLDIDFNLGGAIEATLSVFETDDGGYLVCGLAQDASGDPFGFARFAIARLLADGSFDTSFNENGKFDFALHPDGLDQNRPGGCALAPDGSLVVVGSAMNHGDSFGKIVLARVLTNASLDQDFGEDGMAVVSLPEDDFANARPSAVRIDGQGRIMIAGAVDNLLPRMGPTLDMLAVRLLSDGSIDPGFGFDGIRTVGFDAGDGDIDVANGLVLYPDGSALLVGFATTATNGLDVAAARLTASGDLDPSFGENGRVLHGRDPGTGTHETGVGATVDALGRIYIAGRAMAGPQNDDAAILRLLSNDTIDTSYGVDGWQVFGLDPPPEPSQDTVVSITLDRHNRAVATGAFLVDSAAEDFDFMVARLATDLIYVDRFESRD